MLLRNQSSRLQIRVVELINEQRLDRALDELHAGHKLLMVLMDMAPTDIHLGEQLGDLYKTPGQTFSAADDIENVNRYIGLAANVFERSGNLYHQRGNLAQAVNMYRQAVRLQPEYAYAWHDLFVAYDALASRSGQVLLDAMREAVTRMKETGQGMPGFSAQYILTLPISAFGVCSGGLLVYPL